VQRGFCRLFAALLLACWHGAAAWALLPARADCDAAGRSAEQRFGLPQGLLHAIGVAESGRWDAAEERTVPWPWAVDLAGQGRLFDSEAEALRAVGDELAAGRRNIDVGCFQINLQYHPLAFTDLAQAFDARANADYAARFLSDLHARLGTWQAAVAAYHSATASLGVPYRRRVFAVWPDVKAVNDANPAGFTVIAGVRVWTPVPPGDAPLAIALQPIRQNLPRIVTPGH
jgi:soluble lytic murein transglycosylase-like protein